MACIVGATKTSAERRQQRERAEGRMVTKILAAQHVLEHHRGCRSGRFLDALAFVTRSQQGHSSGSTSSSTLNRGAAVFVLSAVDTLVQ